jgi:hypothetical protein
VFVAVSLAAMLAVAAVAQAQTPTPPAAPDPKSPFVANGAQTDVVLFVKPDKTADFEAVMTKVKEGLAKIDGLDTCKGTPDDKPGCVQAAQKETWKKQAAGWTVFKVAEAGPSGTVVYLWKLDPAEVGTMYDPTSILYAAFPATDAEALYTKLKESLASVNKWTLTKVTEMKGGI